MTDIYTKEATALWNAISEQPFTAGVTILAQALRRSRGAVPPGTHRELALRVKESLSVTAPDSHAYIIESALMQAASVVEPAAPTPSLDEVKLWVNVIAATARVRFGPRSACVVMVGMPIDDTGHDRWAATARGPCLMMRGLMARGSRIVEGIMDEAEK